MLYGSPALGATHPALPHAGWCYDPTENKRESALHKSQISSGAKLGLTAIFCKAVLRGVYCCLQMLVLPTLPTFLMLTVPAPKASPFYRFGVLFPVPTGFVPSSPRSAGATRRQHLGARGGFLGLLTSFGTSLCGAPALAPPQLLMGRNIFRHPSVLINITLPFV